MEDCLREIIEKVKNYDWLDQDNSNHIHTHSLIYDIKQILWKYLLDSNPEKRIYFYPKFWEILEREGGGD